MKCNIYQIMHTQRKKKKKEKWNKENKIKWNKKENERKRKILSTVRIRTVLGTLRESKIKICFAFNA